MFCVSQPNSPNVSGPYRRIAHMVILSDAVGLSHRRHIITAAACRTGLIIISPGSRGYVYTAFYPLRYNRGNLRKIAWIKVGVVILILNLPTPWCLKTSQREPPRITDPSQTEVITLPTRTIWTSYRRELGGRVYNSRGVVVAVCPSFSIRGY